MAMDIAIVKDEGPRGHGNRLVVMYCTQNFSVLGVLHGGAVAWYGVATESEAPIVAAKRGVHSRDTQDNLPGTCHRVKRDARDDKADPETGGVNSKHVVVLHVFFL